MMKRDLPHPAVPPPKDLTVEAWRYSPLSQLLNVLLTRSLPLIRVDRLGDPFEGSVTDEIKARDVIVASQLAGKARWQNLAGTMMPQAPLTPTDVLEQLSRHRMAVLRSTHANCWRMGKESEGMWRLYCGQKDGVAMRTTCAKLQSSITDSATRLGAITYIDYARGGMPSDNYLYPVMHKRDGFADEREVRLLRYLQSDVDAVLADREVKGGPTVRPMAWDPESALDQVVVSPYADEWYYETVCEAVRRLAPPLAGRVVWSALRAEPKH